MAGRKEKKNGGGGDDMPAWLITFSDMMTLMLTFFVLLNSMAVIDEQRKLTALGSIIGTFGMGRESFDFLSTQDSKKNVQPGPMEDIEDLEDLKPLLWEDVTQDLRFAKSRFVQVFSVNADVLFAPNEWRLTGEGQTFLERIAPMLKEVDYPLLLAGHTSVLRDELGMSYRVTELDKVFDPTWELSLKRVISVYRFLLGQGIESSRLKVEAFGQYHPFYDSSTPKGRADNRRVDIVLDKRSLGSRQAMAEAVKKEDRDPSSYDYRGFIFDVENPPWGKKDGN